MRHAILLVIVAGLILTGSGCDRQASQMAEAKELTIFIPCGMILPFMEVKAAFEEENPGIEVDAIFDNANVLVRRIIDKGQRPDIVASPGVLEMETLVEAGPVDQKDVSHFGRYELMLFAPRENVGGVADFEDLLNPEVSVVAIADPEHNSVGRYTKQSLERLGLWEKLQAQGKIRPLDHPITAYTWVARGRAQASFAYRSCPLESAPEKLSYSNVTILKSVPRDFYDPAHATIAVLKDTRRRALAEKFIAFLSSDRGRKLLIDYGVPNPVELNVFVPCGMYDPLFKLKSAFEKQDPSVLVHITFDRADKLTARIVEDGETPDLHMSIGAVETGLLVDAGRVDRADVLPVGRFRLALCTHVSRKGAITKPEDLTKPEVKRIVLTPPENSSVGFYVKESLTELGLWEKVKDKVDYLPTIKDCYAEVANGGADAGFAYLGCPINIDPEEAQYSKVVAVQVLDDETYGGAVANASVLSSSKHPAEAMAFARFLKTPGAQAILKRSGLEPVK